MPFYDWWPFMGFPLIPILFMVVGLAFCFFMMSMMMGRHRGRDGGANRTALDILNERYAKGEIDKAEYDEKRRVIS